MEAKRVGAILPSLSELRNPSVKPMKPLALSDRHVVRFFSRMTHLYGHKWSSVYGAAMDGGKLTASARQWAYDLREMTVEQVLAGMTEVERRALEWPPGPIEFKRLCLGIPSLEQVLDRHTDYGPVCMAIRNRLDWYRIDGMGTKDARALASQQVETAVMAMRQTGDLQAIAAPEIAALAAEQSAAA